MENNRLDNYIAQLRLRKRPREEEERKEQLKVIVSSIVAVVSGVMAWYHCKFRTREPLPDWDHERQCYLNRLYDGAEVDCLENLRVSKYGFSKLCQILQERGGLQRTKHVSIKEAVAMFLQILGHNLKYRVIHLNYYRSKETISRQFSSVLRAVMKISKDYLRSHQSILQGAELNRWRWFENGLGALDGTHIPVIVGAEVRPRYRNRKGYISTNVLGVCDPDMRFIYVLPGWEGSASDSRVLRDALSRRNRFHIPSDKYYLVDAGYTNGPGFLAPYRGTRYHLSEWTGNTPENYKELFNLRHSSARNVIERTFGLLKKRWSILRTPSFFDIKTHIRIINACCVLHNFIRVEQRNDPVLEARDLELLHSVDQELSSMPIGDHNTNNTEDGITSVQAANEWTLFRDQLAMNMFADYQARQGLANLP